MITDVDAARKPGTAYDADLLRRAIASGELVNYYQPVVAIADGRVVGVEALVRWRHPVDGLLLPEQFIGIAENSGLIDDLTRWVVGRAILQAGAWRNAGLALRMAVNLSMGSLAGQSFVDFVLAAVTAAELQPADIQFEVTESRLTEDLRAPLEILTRLHLKHFPLSIDDFGSGHASVAQLHYIPFGEVKIDGRFVHGANVDPSLRAVFGEHLTIARQLGVELVAKGVEDQFDWDFLRRAGCDRGQGHYIARPMPAAEFPGWVGTWEARLREQSSNGTCRGRAHVPPPGRSAP